MRLILTLCLASARADFLSDNGLTRGDLKQMHKRFCQSDAKQKQLCSLSDGELPEFPDAPEWFQQLVELRYEQSTLLCYQFYLDFFGIEDKSKIHNSYIANGGQGLVMKCSTDEEVEPSVVAQKIYYYTRDKNMTESELINVAVSDAGVRPTLYWFHDKGFFEEFLGHKEDLNKHPLQMYQRPVLEKVAQNLAEMHKVSVPDINQAKYKAPYQQDGWTWNTREIKSMFRTMELGYEIDGYLKAMGWTMNEYIFNIEWTEELVRGYYNDDEIPLLCHNDAHGGNMMRDKNGTADTITLIDFDLTGYGFPAFDWAYVLYYSSWSYISFHPGTSFLPSEEIDFFLQNYLTHAGLEDTKSLEEIRNDFDIHLTYVILLNSFMVGTQNWFPMEWMKWAICHLEYLQTSFGHPDPISCEGFPFDKKQCDECESSLVDCLTNCDEDSTCISNCNRDFADCMDGCQ